MNKEPEALQLDRFDDDLPVALRSFWQIQQFEELQRGDRCPNCEQGIVDYDGMLNLGCPKCGFSLAGCFT